MNNNKLINSLYFYIAFQIKIVKQIFLKHFQKKNNKIKYISIMFWGNYRSEILTFKNIINVLFLKHF